MKLITNTFMHEGRVLRPGDAIPDGVSPSNLLEWKSHGLVGDNYNGPTRRAQPAPESTKPAAPSRRQRPAQPAKQPDAPKPGETKAATDNEAGSLGETSTSDAKAPEDKAGQGQAATDDVAQDALQAGQQQPGAVQESA